MTWIWWAPLVASSLHVFEEFVYPGGFADWDRAYRPQINRSITPRFHLLVNALMLLAGLQVGLLASGDSGGAVHSGHALAWLTLTALLFSNAFFHLRGTILTKRYSPGLITALALYVPMTLYGYVYFVGTRHVPVTIALLAALIGGSYHFWAALLHRRRERGAARRDSA